MKFRVTMKTPDALGVAIAVQLLHPGQNAPDEDDEEFFVRHFVQALTVCKRWFHFNECVTLAIDTDAGTCVVEER